MHFLSTLLFTEILNKDLCQSDGRLKITEPVSSSGAVEKLYSKKPSKTLYPKISDGRPRVQNHPVLSAECSPACGAILNTVSFLLTRVKKNLYSYHTHFQIAPLRTLLIKLSEFAAFDLSKMFAFCLLFGFLVIMSFPCSFLALYLLYLFPIDTIVDLRIWMKRAFYFFQVSTSNASDDVNQGKNLLLKIQICEAQRWWKTQKLLSAYNDLFTPFPTRCRIQLIN